MPLEGRFVRRMFVRIFSSFYSASFQEDSSKEERFFKERRFSVSHCMRERFAHSHIV
jgi:hypothetical protein